MLGFVGVAWRHIPTEHEKKPKMLVVVAVYEILSNFRAERPKERDRERERKLENQSANLQALPHHTLPTKTEPVRALETEAQNCYGNNSFRDHHAAGCIAFWAPVTKMVPRLAHTPFQLHIRFEHEVLIEIDNSRVTLGYLMKL